MSLSNSTSSTSIPQVCSDFPYVPRGTFDRLTRDGCPSEQFFGVSGRSCPIDSGACGLQQQRGRGQPNFVGVGATVAKRKSSPPGLMNDWSSVSVLRSTRTALIVTTSIPSCSDGRARSSSNLTASTSVRSSSRVRTTSRRNAAFLVLDSTMRKEIPGAASFIGIAGEPPPEPMSMSAVASAFGRYFVARTGSMSSLSMASSPASSTGRAVRDTLRFHFRRSSKYAYKPSITSAGSVRPALEARLTSFSRIDTLSGYFGINRDD